MSDQRLSGRVASVLQPNCAGRFERLTQQASGIAGGFCFGDHTGTDPPLNQMGSVPNRSVACYSASNLASILTGLRIESQIGEWLFT